MDIGYKGKTSMKRRITGFGGDMKGEILWETMR